MTRSAITIVTTLLLVASATAGAAVEGGQEGVTAHNDGHASTAGPASPGLAWVSEELEDVQWARHGALTLDSEEHVVVPVHGRDEDGDRLEALVALDRADGSIAWEAPGVDRDCDVAADDGGVIYGQGQAGSEATSLLAVDATDGSVLDAKTYTPPETDSEPRMHVCTDGLRLLDDGTLIVVDHRTDSIRAIDTTTTPMSQLWYDDSRSASQMWGRPPVAPDGSAIYQVWVDDGDPRQVHVDAVDPATGAVMATTTVPGDDSTIQPHQGDVVLVDSDGGIVLSTGDSRGTGVGGDDTAHLTRLTPDLGVDWTISIGSDDPVYPSQQGFNSLVQADGLVVGWYGGSVIAAVDRADGSNAWILEPGSFTNNEGRIVAEPDGDTYWSTFGGNLVESADAGGHLRYGLPECSVGFGEARAVGPIADDGTLYLLGVMEEDGSNDLVVAAVRSGEPLPQGDCPQGDERLSGASRFETAIDVSRSAYPQDGSAGAVLLARSDVFADALAGTPLAVQENGPLLITARDSLLPEIADEIRRLLGADPSKTVYLLGGTAALTPGVEAAVRGLGYQTRRIAGRDRIATAIAVAEELDSLGSFMITTGFNFPDALAAGPAAAETGGAVMLTVPGGRAPATDAFMTANPGVPRFAIGGPAASAYPEAEAVSGRSRVETAVAVARRFFEDPPVVGLARFDLFPDSLTGGAHIAAGTPELARRGGPMLLTSPADLLGPVEDYLCDAADTLQRTFVYGGTAAVAQSVADEAGVRITGASC